MIHFPILLRIFYNVEISQQQEYGRISIDIQYYIAKMENDNP